VTPHLRWIAIALFVSLAVNLFLAGTMFGDRLRGRHGPPHPPPAAAEAPAPTAGDTVVRGVILRMVRALPADRQAAFEEKFAQHRPQVQAAQQEMRAARLRLREKMTAEPFDRDEVGAAFEALRQRNLAVQAALHEAVIDASADLPVELRRAMMAAMSEGGGPRPPRPPGAAPGPRP
jgi:uncharacterized membrane protein